MQRWQIMSTTNLNFENSQEIHGSNSDEKLKKRQENMLYSESNFWSGCSSFLKPIAKVYVLKFSENDAIIWIRIKLPIMYSNFENISLEFYMLEGE